MLETSTSPLSEMALRFVEEYLIDPSNQAAAAKRAGYSVETAKESASRLMADPRVKALIKGSLDKAVSKLGITAERVLQRYWQIANPSPDIYIENEDGSLTLKPGSISEVSVTQMGGKGQKNIHSVTSKSGKTADQLKALRDVAEILGLFPEKTEKQVNLSFAQLVEASIPKTTQVINGTVE